jgi:hypothetical protein
MTKKKDTLPLTHEETIELLDKAIRNPHTKPVELARLTTARAKLSPTPSLPSNQVLLKEEDLFNEGDVNVWKKCVECIKSANEIIQTPGFWTLGPDGNRCGPESRRQGRYGDDRLEEFIELCIVIEHLPIPPGCTCRPTIPKENSAARTSGGNN